MNDNLFYESIYGLVSLITLRDDSDESDSEIEAFFGIHDPNISEEKFNQFLIKTSKIKDEKIYQDSREFLSNSDKNMRTYACAIIWITAAVNGLTPDEEYWISRACNDLKITNSDLGKKLIEMNISYAKNHNFFKRN
jgi:hypothetical protein